MKKSATVEPVVPPIVEIKEEPKINQILLDKYERSLDRLSYELVASCQKFFDYDLEVLSFDDAQLS